jgi:AcrR family transcriptional regulator
MRTAPSSRVPASRARSPAPPGPRDLFQDLPPKRARLLRAALDLFVERGFDATSVPEVARRARIATGSIYLHFRDKRDLVNALLAHLRGHVAARLVAEVDLRAPLRRQFDAIWDVLAGHLLRHPEAFAFCDLHHHATYLDPKSLEAWTPGGEVLDAHVRLGRRQGVYRDLSDAALRALLAGPILAASKVARMEDLRLTPAFLAGLREAVWVGLQRPRGARRGPGGAR